MPLTNKSALGIDIGGSGVKAAIVDVERGVFISERQRIATPQPATLDALLEVIAQLRDHFEWRGPTGVGIPGVVQGERVRWVGNLDNSWNESTPLPKVREIMGGPIAALNDADAAALAEGCYGAGKEQTGNTLVITVGTGLGTALLVDGRLAPNLELGHLWIPTDDDKRYFVEAEKWASGKIRDKENLSLKQWAARFQVYLDHMHKYLWPDRIIIGGGIVKKFSKWSPHIECPVPILPAQLGNHAGIIGAARRVAELSF